MMGWHAVNVSANDVATSGIIPDTISVISLFPEGTSEANIDKLKSELKLAASLLDITIISSLIEIVKGLKRPVVVVTALGSGNNFVTSSDARCYDCILMTKTAGIEGTSILARLPEMKDIRTRIRRRGLEMIKKLSVIEEARIAFEHSRINAMHDVTEGGIIGAVYEMSIAAQLGFEIYSDSIPIDFSTRQICARVSVDPLRLIGSGSLLISCPSESCTEVARSLASKKIQCSVIGKFMPISSGRWICSSGKRTKLRENSIQDEIWVVLRKNRKLT